MHGLCNSSFFASQELIAAKEPIAAKNKKNMTLDFDSVTWYSGSVYDILLCRNQRAIKIN